MGELGDMTGNDALVTCEFRQLGGTDQAYFVLTFAPQWCVEHLRAALVERARIIGQRPPKELFESILIFESSESFESVNLIGEMRRALALPGSRRIVHTSVIGLGEYGHVLIDNLLDLVRRVYRGTSLHYHFYASLGDALDAMRERALAAD